MSETFFSAANLMDDVVGNLDQLSYSTVVQFVISTPLLLPSNYWLHDRAWLVRAESGANDAGKVGWNKQHKLQSAVIMIL